MGALQYRKPNLFRVDGAVVWLLLKHGEFCIDLADWDRVKEFRWCSYKAPRTTYARTTNAIGPQWRLHQYILGIRGVDHIDTHGWNNRRSNLRPATKSQNGANRLKNRNNQSGFKGVSKCGTTGRWKVSITTKQNGWKFLGRFDTPEEASQVYAQAARASFGEFARL